jgi:mRNA-degrading endonuclease toxin of MazEF toxin-antitoxin module
MKQWDIFLYPFPTEADPHFFVIFSPDSICANPIFTRVNGLACQTVRPPTRPARPFEVYLDRADRFDWKTLVRCQFVHDLDKSLVIGAKKGTVSPARIQEIRQKLRAIF